MALERLKDQTNSFETRVDILIKEAQSRRAKIPEIPSLRMLRQKEKLDGRISALQETLQIHALSSPISNKELGQKILKDIAGEIGSINRVKSKAKKKQKGDEITGSATVILICELQLKTLNRTITIVRRRLEKNNAN